VRCLNKVTAKQKQTELTNNLVILINDPKTTQSFRTLTHLNIKLKYIIPLAHEEDMKLKHKNSTKPFIKI